MKKELFRYYSAVTEREMSAVVITPDTAGEHPILYALHGYWGTSIHSPTTARFAPLLKSACPTTPWFSRIFT